MNRLTYFPWILLYFFFGLKTEIVLAQIQDTVAFDDFQIVIDLDEFEVSASRFSVEDFVEMVQTDESFYAAFQNIRFLSYESSNVIHFFDKKGKAKASYENIIQQISNGQCREMTISKEESSGNFYKKKKKYRYFTAKMLDRLFFTNGKVCEQPNVPLKDKKESSKMEQYVGELKKLIFRPGEKVDVPMIGNKMAIFSPKMSRYYNFSILSKSYQNTIDCYVFSASLKTEFASKKGKTVLKDLHTYFDKTTMQVVARDYRLSYSTAVYDFDVSMKIELSKFGEQYVPSYIRYDGNWDVPAKKPEIAVFEIRFWDYK